MQYCYRFQQLIELERQAERDRHQQEIENLTAHERRQLGRCEFYLRGFKAPAVFHYTVVRFAKKGRLDTKISVGDLVLVSKGNPLESDLTGTVTQINKTCLLVAFENLPPKWVYSSGIRVDLYTNDIPYVRMQQNLIWFQKIKHPLKSFLLGERPAFVPKPVDFEPYNKQLNPSQRDSISSALGTRDMFLIHGPPGTGKTTTLAELVFQAVNRSKRVLATAESNTAADNLLVKLSRYPDLKIVRVGHPARIVPGFEEYSLFAHFNQHPLAQKIIEKKNEVLGLRTRQKKFQRPIPALRRGMSDEEIARSARSGKGRKGVRVKTMCLMYGWLKIENQVSQKMSALKELEAQIFSDILKSADVVISTNSMAGSEVMTDQYFDLAVIDEGSQQVEPSTLIPILKARRFILAGDDCQLPPTVINPKAQDLKYTLFARLKSAYPQNSAMLTVQYRMNDSILSFPKHKFYSSQLRSAKTVQSHTIADLLADPQKAVSELLNPERPVVFDDTSLVGEEAFEHRNHRQFSYENNFEVTEALQLVEECLSSGLQPEHIGIISPYAAQVRLMKKTLGDLSVEVDSIDGFQGREKEVIILSLVRANLEGNIGFLEDVRRLNVAITRAKRKLIIIGHGATVKHHPVYKEWLETIR